MKTAILSLLSTRLLCRRLPVHLRQWIAVHLVSGRQGVAINHVIETMPAAEIMIASVMGTVAVTMTLAVTMTAATTETLTSMEILTMTGDCQRASQASAMTFAIMVVGGDGGIAPASRWPCQHINLCYAQTLVPTAIRR